MGLQQTNTTCDLFRSTKTPPGDDPDAAAVPCLLTGNFAEARNTVSKTATGTTDDNYRWTHVLLVAPDVDIRDAYALSEVGSAGDKVYIPDENGTLFRVKFVERINRGTPADVKRVYLDRDAPTWPTSEL